MITPTEAYAAGGPAAAARVRRRAGRRALPRGVLRRGGEAVDPRRPAVRRHPAGSPRPALRRRPPHPDHRRPRDAGAGRGGRRRDPARPERPGRLARVDRSRHRLRAGHGRRPRLLRDQPDRQAQPGHPGPSPGGIVVQAARPRDRAHAGDRSPLPDLGAVLHHDPDGRERRAVAARATTAGAAAAPSPSPRARCGPTTPSTRSW